METLDSAFSTHHRFVRYDERGCGLSDWQIPEQSFDAWVQDLETVVDALGIDRFDLLGISQGGAVAATYAARHPERVSHLILNGAYARGWNFRNNPREIEARDAIIKLIRLGWGKNNPAFRQIFTTRFLPDGTPEEADWFDDLQRITASPENAARFMEEFSRIDVVRSSAISRCRRLFFTVRTTGRWRSTRGGCWRPRFAERRSCRCRGRIICSSNTSRRGRSCSESWLSSSGGDRWRRRAIRPDEAARNTASVSSAVSRGLVEHGCGDH